jgi:hypothetical protein
MNLITVILIALVIWLVYSLIQSYRNLEKELKEIRAKCIGVNNITVKESEDNPSKTTNIPKPKETVERIVGNKTDVSPTKVNTDTPSGAYTSTGDQLYSSENNSTLYDNDPLISMRNSVISGLKNIKHYATI